TMRTAPSTADLFSPRRLMSRTASALRAGGRRRRRARIADVHDDLPAPVGLSLPDGYVLSVAHGGLTVRGGPARFVGAVGVAQITGGRNVRLERLPGKDVSSREESADRLLPRRRVGV